jgi:shikimate kinase
MTTSLKKPVALVGMPSCGKSTAAKLLEKRLGCESIDLDSELVLRLGCSIPEFFQRHGEAAFRQEETCELERVCALGPRIISTGGGAVLAERNRMLLRRHCVVFYLRVPLAQLMRRLAGDTSRPLLQVENPEERVKQMHRERDPLYQKVAHFTVEGRGAPMNLVHAIAMQLELSGQAHPR